MLDARWPGVKYGNYDMSRVDAMPDTTPWYSVVPVENPPGVDVRQVRHTPAGRDRPDAAERPAPDAAPARLAEVITCSGRGSSSTVGTADSPVLYPLNCYQLMVNGSRTTGRGAPIQGA